MGQAARTTKLPLDFSDREVGGANREKRRCLEETARVLDAARRFYLTFLLDHAEKLRERVEARSAQTNEVKEVLLSADKLLTWTEFQTVETEAHPDPRPEWNFSQAFPDFPNRYRRSVSAPRHAVMYLPMSGKEFGGTFLGHPSYLDLKSEGNHSMMETRETSRDVADEENLQDPHRMAKARLLEP